MTTDQIYVRLTQIFHDLFDDSSIALDTGTTAADVDGWDSFAHINLLLMIENEFGIKFNTADMDNMLSVGDLVSYIQTHLKPV